MSVTVHLLLGFARALSRALSRASGSGQDIDHVSSFSPSFAAPRAAFTLNFRRGVSSDGVPSPRPPVA